jgi:LGFP repeat
MTHWLSRYFWRSAIVALIAVVLGTALSAPASADPRCANNDPFYGYCVGGKILQEFNEAGGFNFFGNATTPESNTQNGGKYQKFTKNSTIYWHQNVSGGHANSVGGLIRDKWVALGYELGVYGFPTTREQPARKPGRYNLFQGGAVYWAQGASQAYAVLGGSQIEQTWAANDWENGSYGFPTSEEFDFEGGKKQNFQNGSIVWKPEGFPEDWSGDEGGTDYATDCAPANSTCGQDARGLGVAAKTLPTLTPTPPSLQAGSRITSEAQACDTTQPTTTESTEPTTTSEPSSTADSPDTATSTPTSTSPIAPPTSRETVPSIPVESTTQSPAPTSGPSTETTPSTAATVPPESSTPTTEPASEPSVWCRGQAHSEAAAAPNNRAVTTFCDTEQEVWKGSREQACYLDRTAAFILKSTENEEIGRIEGIESIDVNPTWNSTVFYTEYNFEITNVEGEAAPAFFTINHECVIRSGGGTCDGAGDSVVSQPALEGTTLTVSSSFTVPVGSANSGALRFAQALARIVLTSPTNEEMKPFSQEIQTARVRCDSQPTMRNTTGCVIGDVEPVWDLRGYSDLPQYRQHVSLAQTSGLPGFADNSGNGTPLTRITNTQWIKDRRAITCGGVTGPRTGGRDCDEYPMASTTQGGGNGSGYGVARTFPQSICGIRDTGIVELSDPPQNRGAGWSVCLISSSQNRRAGSLQGWFYTKSRVIAGDGFLVRPN